MYISHKWKHVHISIPRTGSTFVNQHLNNLCHDEPFIHHAGIQTLRRLFPKIRSYTCSAFVRNPFDRLVSIYTELSENRGCAYSGRINFQMPCLLSATDAFRTRRSRFSYFVERLPESRWVTDVFFRPQRNFTCIDASVVVDCIGRYENLAFDFLMIREKYMPNEGVKKVEHGCRVRGSKRNRHYSSYYTPTAKNVAEELYHEDIKEFSYEF